MQNCILQKGLLYVYGKEYGFIWAVFQFGAEISVSDSTPLNLHIVTMVIEAPSTKVFLQFVFVIKLNLFARLCEHIGNGWYA